MQLPQRGLPSPGSTPPPSLGSPFPSSVPRPPAPRGWLLRGPALSVSTTFLPDDNPSDPQLSLPPRPAARPLLSPQPRSSSSSWCVVQSSQKTLPPGYPPGFQPLLSQTELPNRRPFQLGVCDPPNRSARGPSPSPWSRWPPPHLAVPAPLPADPPRAPVACRAALGTRCAGSSCSCGIPRAWRWCPGPCVSSEPWPAWRRGTLSSCSSISTGRCVEHTPNHAIKRPSPQQKREDEGPAMEHSEVIINFLLEPSRKAIRKTI